MKKTKLRNQLSIFIAVFSIVLLSINADAQILSEDFNNGIPGTFTLIDNDGLTPNAGVVQYTNAWVAQSDPTTGDSAASSTSWYNPAGTSDDWLITPIMAFTPGLYLSWKARNYDVDYKDGYQVWISSTGNTVNDFLVNGTMIYQNLGEDIDYRPRILDLENLGYTAGNYYIAFRNNSTDKYRLNIDDIVVGDSASSPCIDNVTRLNTSFGPTYDGYLTIPIRQASNMQFQAVIQNSGIKDEAITLDLDLYVNNVSSFTSSYSTTVLANETDSLYVGNYTPTDTGFYIPFVYVTNVGDCDVQGDFGVHFFVTDSTYGREYTTPDGTIGTQGNTAVFGQNFDIVQTDTLTSVSVYIAGATSATGDSLRVVVHNTAGSTPTTLLASSEPQYIFGGGAWYQVRMPDVELTAGEYFIGVEQQDTNFLSLGTNTGLHTPGKTWIEVPIGAGNWATNESYNRTENYAIRANFGKEAAPPADVKIYDIQYTTDISGDSPYDSTTVTTSGIVTAVRSDGRFYIQDSSSTWNGILVFDNNYTVNVGDNVTLTGYVVEYFNLTEIKDVTSLTVNSIGNTIPSPLAVTSINANNEQYEGVLVTCVNTEALSNVNGFGEWTTNDGSGTLVVDDELTNPITFNPVLNSFYTLTGIITYNFSQYKLIPRDTTADIQLFVPGSMIASIPVQPTCPLETFDVNVAGSFNTGNKLQVFFYWDNTFATDYVIGEIDATTSTSILCSVPNWSSNGPYYVIVRSSNPVGVSDTVFVNNISGTHHNQVDSITGPASMCLQENNLLFNAFHTEATQYVWTFPNGTSFNSNDSLPTVDVNFDATVTGGRVYAQTVGTCGLGIVPVTEVQLNTNSGALLSTIATQGWGGSTLSAITADLLRTTDLSASFEGCDVFAPGTFTNKIAVIDRGSCSFSRKVYNAQQAGALGVIIRVPSDYVSGPYTGASMGSGDLSGFITIPATLINEQGSGGNDTLLSYLNAGTVNVSLIPSGFDLNITVSGTAEAGANQSICEGESANLLASGGITYAWDNALGAGASKTVSPTTTTTYKVTASTGGSCPSQDSVVITVNPLPTLATSSDTSLCSGESTTLVASGANSYLWDNSLGAGASHTVSPSSMTTYKVVGTSTAGCKDSTTITVNINATPTASTSPSVTICEGASTNISASGGGTYSWDNGLNTASAHTVSPTTNTTYIVTVSTGPGCTDTAHVIVNVNAKPTASTSSDPTICEGASTTITASGGGTYLWDNALGTGNSKTVSPSSTTPYMVEVTSALGCKDSSIVTVNVNAKPNASTSSDVTICDGISTTLTASGGGTYLWDNGLGTGNSKTVSPSSSTTYEVEVSSAQGCKDSSSVTVTVDATPTASTSADATICEGTSAMITASGGSSYAWDNGLGTGSSHTVSPTTTTIYEVEVSSAQGCKDSSTVTINVNPTPTAFAGNDATICQMGSAQINATGGVSYMWDQGLGAGQSQIVTPSTNTTYTVTVTDANNCTDTDNITITVNPIPGPTANAGGDTTICEGNSVNLQASGGLIYNWDQGLGNGAVHTVTPTATTNYTVTVTDVSGCSDIDEMTIIVNAAPTANAGSDTSVCEGETITLIANGGDSYSWDNGLGSGATQPISPTITTIYTVTATLANGCSNTDQVQVTVDVLPAQPSITLFGGDLLSSETSGNQWLINGVSIPGASGQTYQPIQNGIYSVRVTNSNGCSNTSDTLFYTIDGIEDHMLTAIDIYPNPTKGLLTVSVENSGKPTHTKIRVMDILGKEIYFKTVKPSQNSNIPVSLKDQPAGMYFVEISIGENKKIVKVVKE